jgi:hypothetical protein
MYDPKENKAKVVPPVQYASWSSRRMLTAIRKKRSSLSEHVDPFDPSKEASDVTLEVPEPNLPTSATEKPASSLPLHFQRKLVDNTGEETGSDLSQFADHELSSQSESPSRFHVHNVNAKHHHVAAKKHVPTEEEMFYTNATVSSSKKVKKNGKKKLPDNKIIFESTSEEEEDDEESGDESSTRPVLELVNAIESFKENETR